MKGWIAVDIFLNEIEKINCVNKTTQVKPNYDLTNSERYIQLAFDSKGNVLIVGVIDNNYIHWLSKTSIDDIRTNENIFNYLVNENYFYISQMYLALNQIGIEWDSLKEYYMVDLKPFHDSKIGWDTPFGHYYGKDQKEHNGHFFATDVKNFLNKILYKCIIREGDGQYINLLKYYISILNCFDFMEYDKSIKLIREILENEQYLRISENAELREAYIECMDIISSKYNQYMTAVR